MISTFILHIYTLTERYALQSDFIIVYLVNIPIRVAKETDGLAFQIE